MIRRFFLGLLAAAPPTVWAELEVYYDFAHIHGVTVPNLAPGATVDGRIEGAATPDLVAGAPGGGSPGTALWFDGVDDFVDLDIRADDLGMLDGDFAVTAWVLLGGTQAEAPVLGQGANVVFYFGFRNLVPRFRTSGQDIEAAAGFLAEPYRWTHCAWVHHQGLMSLYLDGFCVTQVVAGGNHINTLDPHIGEISGNWFFRGAVDEFAVFSASITAEQVEFLAKGGRPDALPPAAPRYVTAPFGPGGTWNLYQVRGLVPGQGELLGWTDQLLAARVPNPLVPGETRLGHLAWIESAAEHGFLRRLAGTLSGFWIGLSDNEAHGGSEGNFVWVGDPTNPVPPPLDFTRWQPGQPDDMPRPGNDGQDAGLVTINGDWGDQYMGGGSQPRIIARGAIIEWEVGSPDPVPGAQVYSVLPDLHFRFPTPPGTAATWSIRQVADTTRIESLDEAVACLLSRRGTITDSFATDPALQLFAADLAVHARARMEVTRAGMFTFTSQADAPLALRIAGEETILTPGAGTARPLVPGFHEVELVTFSSIGGLDLDLDISSPDGGTWRLAPERLPPAPAAFAIRRENGGPLHLFWQGEPGERYQVRASSGLEGFTPFGPPVVGTPEPSRIQVNPSGSAGFYRLEH